MNATTGICHSVWMAVWVCRIPGICHSVDDRLLCRMVSCIPDGHPHRVTNTRCRIDTVISPDDGHIVEIVHQIDFIYKYFCRADNCLVYSSAKVCRLVVDNSACPRNHRFKFKTFRTVTPYAGYRPRGVTISQ